MGKPALLEMPRSSFNAVQDERTGNGFQDERGSNLTAPAGCYPPPEGGRR